MSIHAMLFVSALITILAAAVVTDLRAHRIPNWLTAPALCAGVALQGALMGWSGVGQAIAGAAIGLSCFAPFYLGRGMGAGDLKLMAAAGSFLGPQFAFQAAVLALCAGAVMAAAYVAWQATRAAVDTGIRSSWSDAGAAGWTAAGMARRHRLAFAAPIAVGSMGAAFAAGWLPGLS